MHRDIKPLNILINSRGEIKLCDFGASRILDDSTGSTHVGTVAYWPPERFTDSGLRYDFRAEIWSLGITILEFILGKLPYIQNEEKDRSRAFCAFYFPACKRLQVCFCIRHNYEPQQRAHYVAGSGLP